jgi:ADP-heptose:LPS heptosyltransferase
VKIQLARIADKVAGVPICILYGLFKKIVPFPPPRDMKPRRILVIKYFGLGSITFIASALETLAKNYPESEIYLLTFSGNKPLFDLLKMTRKPTILTVSDKNPYTFFRDTLKMFFKVRKMKFDVVIDYEVFSAYTELLTAFSNAPLRIGYYLAAFWRRALYSHYIMFHNVKHVLLVYLDALKYLGINDPVPEPVKVEIPEDVMTSMETKMAGFDFAKTVGINIHASDLALVRRWPPENFKEIVEKLVSDGYDVVFTGIRSERRYTRHLVTTLDSSVVGKVHNLCGKLSLKEFAALLTRLPLFISNDSGPFHLACIADCKTVSFWGPQSPVVYGPFFDTHMHLTMYSHRPCSPCIHIPRTKPGKFCNQQSTCLRNITPNQAWDKIQQALPTIDE